MKLREYQNEAVQNTLIEFEKHDAVLAVMATGLGKTVFFSHVAKHFMQYGRVMMLAHREELIYQGKDKMGRVTGVDADIEMGQSWALNNYFKSDIIVSTVQTQIAGMDGEGRMTRFDPNEFSLLIIDEAHHAVAQTYQRVIQHYRQNPKLKVLGVTATPDRTDEEALGKIFTSVSYEYDIRNGIEDGWLVPIEQMIVEVRTLDFSQMRTTAGDLNGKDLAAQMEFEENLHGIADPTLQIVGNRKTLVFAASVAQAERLSEIFNRHKPGCAEFVTGGTPKEYRRKVFDAFAKNQLQFLTNVGVACLDEQTEILTSNGWVGHKEITESHEIANWKDGKIHFSKPLAIEIRDRRPDERMVYLETKNRSIRVTDDHRMLYRTARKGKYHVCRAKELVNRSAELPICGLAEPRVFAEQRDRDGDVDIRRRISANSYALRKQGYGINESKAEAKRRIHLHQKLRHKLPHELTKEECTFIGFWLGDGTMERLQSGGVDYKIWQAESYPNICSWIETILSDIGVDYRRKTKPPRREGGSPVAEWSIPRGTGFGPQRRRGLYAIEKYLNKNGSHLLWGLDCEQFDSLLKGFWYADGEHADAKEPPSGVYRICNTNKPLLDLLQAIAVCRGYRANITDGKTNHSRNPSHKPLWRLSLSYRGMLGSHSMTKYRLKIEDVWRPEKVWCVKSETGFIVTRRRNTVTVTGNTEGFDDPGIEVVVMARPTKSRCLYTQMCLDSKTEILTTDGWIGIDDKSDGYIAAFDMATERIVWEKPQRYVRRSLLPHESFYSICNPHIDIRVTDGHNLVARSRHGRKKTKGRWELIPAGRACKILPDGFEVPVSGKPSKKDGLLLTDDEIRFLGLLHTDGNYNASNGQITLYQSERYPENITYIETVLKNCGFKFGSTVETSATNLGERRHPLHRWTISKGRPRGKDSHLRGWGALWRHLTLESFEYATPEQLGVLVEAMNVGDGVKRKHADYDRKTYSICTADKSFADFMQSLLVRNGFKCNIGLGGTNRSMFMLHIRPNKNFWSIKTKATDGRPVFREETVWAKERVWCVTVPSGAIVTRRNGKVAIVGNCGRGTRPLDGVVDGLVDAVARKSAIACSAKPSVEIIDFVGNCGRHKLVSSADILGGKHTNEVIELAKEYAKSTSKNGKPANMMTELQKAESEIARRRRMAEESAARKHIRGKATFHTRRVNPFDMFDITPYRERGWHKGRLPTTKQINYLQKNGVDTDGMTFTQASQLIDTLIKRRESKLCTFKQAKVLKRAGLNPKDLTFIQASKLIDALSKNNWKPTKEMLNEARTKSATVNMATDTKRYVS